MADGRIANGILMAEPIAAVDSISGPATQGRLQVAGLDPPRLPSSERPHRRADTQVAESMQQLSLQGNPSGFHDVKVGNPQINASLEEVERSLSSSLPPQRTPSSSSSESDQDLKEQLQAASSDHEKVAVYRQYTKDLKRENRTLTDILNEKLQLVTEERDKLSALLDAAGEENTSKEKDYRFQLAYQESMITVLQEAVQYALSGKAIPDDIHQHLNELGLSDPLTETDSPEVDNSEMIAQESPVQGSTCPFSDLNHHGFRQLLVTNLIQTRGTQCLGCAEKRGRIDSHPYGGAILISAAAFALQLEKEEVEPMKLFWRGDLQKKGPAVHAGICTYPFKREAFCGKCDNSTSQWEGAFAKQIKTGTVWYNGKDITKAILLVQMFRGALFSISLDHYMECQACGRYFKDVGSSVLELKRFHEAVCQGSSEVDEKCEQLKPVVFHNTQFQGKVLYPIVVYVQGYGIILYAQIPPFFWAIPAPSCERELTLPEFVTVVDKMASRCSQEEMEFFSKDEAARKWKEDILPQEPVLIFPLFQSNCCVEL